MTEKATTENKVDSEAGEPNERRISRLRLFCVVALGFFIALGASAMKNTITASLAPIAHGLNVSQGTFAIAPSLFMLVYAISSPILGYTADRIGSRATLLLGLFGGSALFLICGSATSFTWFSAAYGAGMATAYAALSYVPLGVFVDEMFPPERRGIIYAILMNGTAAGFITLVPLWIAIGGARWRQVYVGLAIALLVLALLAATLLPRDRITATRAAVKSAPPMLSETIASLVHSPVFWTVSSAFIGCGVTMGFVDVNLVPFMNMSGMSAPTVSTTIALLGAAEITGALLAGHLVDRGRPLLVLAGCYLIRAFSLVLLVLAPTTLSATAFGLLFGVSYLGTVVASSMFVINSVGPRAKGLALGLMWLLHQVGAFVISEGGGLSYAGLHSYDPVVIGSAAVAGCSFLLSAVVLPKLLRSQEAIHA